MSRGIPREPYVLLSCGCLETMFGALHELGSKVAWEKGCFWHGWQTVTKILTDNEAGEIYFARKVRHQQNTLF